MVPVANALLARAAVPQENVVSLEPQKARQPYECHENTTCPNVCFSPVKAKTILTVYIGNWFSTVSTGNQCREAVYILGIMGCALLSLPPSLFSHFHVFVFSLPENCTCGPQCNCPAGCKGNCCVCTCVGCPGSDCKCGPSCKCTAGSCSCAPGKCGESKAMTALRMPQEHNLSKCVFLTSKPSSLETGFPQSLLVTSAEKQCTFWA